jgi:hypothetical protein
MHLGDNNFCLLQKLFLAALFAVHQNSVFPFISRTVTTNTGLRRDGVWTILGSSEVKPYMESIVYSLIRLILKVLLTFSTRATIGLIAARKARPRFG